MHHEAPLAILDLCWLTSFRARFGLEGMPISDMGGELAVIAEHLRTTIRLTLDCLFGVDTCRYRCNIPFRTVQLVVGEFIESDTGEGTAENLSALVL
jgi:hypothetical protein